MGKKDNKTSFYMIFEAIKLFVSYTSGRVNVGDEVTWGYQHDHTDNHRSQYSTPRMNHQLNSMGTVFT
jgi:hypothetical protein